MRVKSAVKKTLRRQRYTGGLGRKGNVGGTRMDQERSLVTSVIFKDRLFFFPPVFWMVSLIIVQLYINDEYTISIKALSY